MPEPITVTSDDGQGELPIKEHVLMVNDRSRGERYLEAMTAKIRPGDVVLEVGTGAGLLSCMAARLGARRVYTVERSAVMGEVARKVFAANGLSDKITLLHADSKDLGTLGAIHDPIDVFVTETIGTLGLDEGISLIFDHIKPLLARDARVIPENVKFKQCLVNMNGIREQAEITRPIFGFDLSALNGAVKTNHLCWPHPIETWREVSTTAETPTYDLLDFAAAESRQEMDIVVDDTCDGMLTWAEFKLAERVILDTRCRHFGNSWPNSVHLMPRATVWRGQSCICQFRLRDDRVGWQMNWNIDDK